MILRGRGLGAPAVHKSPVDGREGSVYEARTRHEFTHLSTKLFLSLNGIVAVISLPKGLANVNSPDVTCSRAGFSAYNEGTADQFGHQFRHYAHLCGSCEVQYSWIGYRIENQISSCKNIKRRNRDVQTRRVVRVCRARKTANTADSPCGRRRVLT